MSPPKHSAEVLAASSSASARKEAVVTWIMRSAPRISHKMGLWFCTPHSPQVARVNARKTNLNNWDALVRWSAQSSQLKLALWCAGRAITSTVICAFEIMNWMYWHMVTLGPYACIRKHQQIQMHCYSLQTPVSLFFPLPGGYHLLKDLKGCQCQVAHC